MAEIKNVVYTSDRREVVLCKNCTEWDREWQVGDAGDDVHYCPIIDKVTLEDWFCASGERRGVK